MQRYLDQGSTDFPKTVLPRAFFFVAVVLTLDFQYAECLFDYSGRDAFDHSVMLAVSHKYYSQKHRNRLRDVKATKLSAQDVQSK